MWAPLHCCLCCHLFTLPCRCPLFLCQALTPRGPSQLIVLASSAPSGGDTRPNAKLPKPSPPARVPGRWAWELRACLFCLSSWAEKASPRLPSPMARDARQRAQQRKLGAGPSLTAGRRRRVDFTVKKLQKHHLLVDVGGGQHTGGRFLHQPANGAFAPSLFTLSCRGPLFLCPAFTHGAPKQLIVLASVHPLLLRFPFFCHPQHT